MSDSGKIYWLFIASYVYCCIKAGQALLYHTQSGDYIETDDPEVIALLRALQERKNLGAIRCEVTDLQSDSLREFITEFCEKGMGGMADVAQMPEKPVQMMPVLNLQQDQDRLKFREEHRTGENLLKYLLELNVYLYTGCDRHCPSCHHYFRQNLCCSVFPGREGDGLAIPVLRHLLAQIQYGTVGQINLLGGNLFAYPDYQELPELFAGFRRRTHLWVHYTAFSGGQGLLDGFIYDVVVTFPVEEQGWKVCMALPEEIQARFHFYLTDAGEYEKAEELIAKCKIGKYALHPTYTGENYGFFEEYIFMDRSDVLGKRLSFRPIFAHQKLNTHFFGSLTVYPDGGVYANVNGPSLGNAGHESLISLIHKEMITNTAWRKIRDTRPCTDCLYQYLCPSPSNYETVMGKVNLCRMKK